MHDMHAPPPPMRRVPAAPATAAAQGPLDWLVPFIPPFLRVNRDTRAALFAALQSLSLAALAAQLIAFLQRHARSFATYGFLLGSWLYGLAWTDRAAPEFTGAYVILSGLAALAVHMYSGDAAANADGISAYSVFNKGGARMLGSLSAEQFEVRTDLMSSPVRVYLSVRVSLTRMNCLERDPPSPAWRRGRA